MVPSAKEFLSSLAGHQLSCNLRLAPVNGASGDPRGDSLPAAKLLGGNKFAGTVIGMRTGPCRMWMWHVPGGKTPKQHVKIERLLIGDNGTGFRCAFPYPTSK